MEPSTRPVVVAAIAFAVSLVSFGCSRREPAQPRPQASAEAQTRLPGASAAHVEIPRGGTLAQVRGTLAPEQDAEYVVSEEQGALLVVQVIGHEHDPAFSVHRADTGERLPDDHPRNVAHWIKRVPDTLGYLVVVHGTGQPSDYTLSIEAPRELLLDESTKSLELGLTAPAHATVAYVLPPGGPIRAELRAAPSDAFLTAEALDSGEPRLKAAAGARTFAGAAVQADDPVILRVHQGAEPGDITLKVERQ